KDDDFAVRTRQDYVRKSSHQPAHRAEVGGTLPGLLEFIFERELLADSFQDAVVPLLCGQVLSKAGQVQDGHSQTVHTKAGCGPHHNRSLTNLTAREDVTDIASFDRLVQLLR